ncbi:hypothetical protein BUALT_Bualt05G0165100 [Buddleja alternifolia]|uniref:Sieve element occlusion n=1 Tax=Buddleja alternifolia TaxID=168488 RepID=A0AAV6XT34_9LAMI|nr:hypothetical protein BUALT_Bualt05G0165100 [Buddleja alternifolia]
MASRDAVPATKALPLTTQKELLTKALGADHSLSPRHEPDHTPVKAFPPVTTRGRQMARHDQGRFFFSSDDNALTKHIVATHAPDIEELDVKPVLSIVEDIMRFARPTTAETSHTTTLGAPIHAKLDTLDHKILHGYEHDSEIVKFLAFPINKISCEIISNCSVGGESHSVTMDLLKSLSNYSWDAKVVITFAAFAINYGEFWLVEQLHTKNPLAKNIAMLKDLADRMAHSGHLGRQFEAVLDLLNAVVKVTHCIVEFKELPSTYISSESPEITTATAHIPLAVYWVIRSLLACASTFLNLAGSGHEYINSTIESWEISSLAHKLSVIMEHLQNQLMICKDLIERKKSEDAYTAFKKLMETSHIDNMRVLRAIIRSREDQKPLYDGSRKTNERLEVLRLKYVLLLISDLEVPHEELNILHMIYSQNSMRHQYEVLWLPLVDPKTSMASLQDTTFYDLRNNSTPWYSVDHPSLVEHVAIRYIREVWKFTHMPILVVLDPQGKPSNLDALPMMWIWGSTAFPFTGARERDLWSEINWNIELLADSIDPRIPDWIAGNKVICLYGGEEIEWIRRFTLSARAAADALGVPLEMLYVGKRNPKDKVRRCHEIINREKLSHIFSLNEYYDYVWYFWVRLWSMWNSKKKIGMTVDTDHMMQEIMDVLTFDSSEHGWAVFSRGNHEMTKGIGDIVLPVLENYSQWSYNVDRPDVFVRVLDEQIKGVHPEHHCNRLILPGNAGYIPEKLVCSECGKVMDKYVMYRCCTD